MNGKNGRPRDADVEDCPVHCGVRRWTRRDERDSELPGLQPRLRAHVRPWRHAGRGLHGAREVRARHLERGGTCGSR